MPGKDLGEAPGDRPNPGLGRTGSRVIRWIGSEDRIVRTGGEIPEKPVPYLQNVIFCPRLPGSAKGRCLFFYHKGHLKSQQTEQFCRVHARKRWTTRGVGKGVVGRSVITLGGPLDAAMH